jgi:hypothetical protein
MPDKLYFWKLCSCWVLKIRTEEHKMKRHASVLTFLTRYIEQGEDFLSRIVTRRDMGVTLNPWIEAAICRVEAQIIVNKDKILTTFQLTRSCASCFRTENVFCILNSYLKAQQSTQVSVVTLKMCCAIQNKQRSILTRGVVMLHDNARPHTAAATQDLFVTFGWEQFDQPPLQPRLSTKWFLCVPASENFPWWLEVPRWRGRRSR